MYNNEFTVILYLKKKKKKQTFIISVASGEKALL